MVLLCDDYLKIKDEVAQTTPSTFRFLKIARALPMELQMVLANRMCGISRDIVPLQQSEAAFQAHINHFDVRQ